MKYFFLLLSFATLPMFVSCQGLKGLLKKAEKIVKNDVGLSEDEAGKGLKQALEIGVGEAVDYLSADDGYYKSVYKILLPEEAQRVAEKLRVIPGFSDVEEDMIQKINHAAEDAAKKATPIFVDAIRGMTFEDALKILMGEQDAATRYLENSTYENLYHAFKPVVISSLDEWNARTYWREAVNAHNKLPFVKKANPELDDHVTRKALYGLFQLIEKKEEGIRSDVGQRTTDLLRKVFSKQD